MLNTPGALRKHLRESWDGYVRQTTLKWKNKRIFVMQDTAGQIHISCEDLYVSL